MIERRKDKYKKRDEELEKEENHDRRKVIIKKIAKVVFVVLVIFLSFYSYMRYVGTSGLKVKEYRVASKKLPSEMHGLKIVHFSDLNYLSTVGEKELKNVVNKINEIKPDIVVFTGNLISKKQVPSKTDDEVLTKYLKKIDAKIGKYAIRGNNDYSNQYNAIMDKANFKIISNSYELIYYKGNIPIMLVGCGSLIKKDCDLGETFSFDKMDNIYTIALIHEPDIADKIVNSYNANLILAGHSLNGQIRLPGIGGLIKINGAKKYYNPKYTFKNSTLYVSGGIGTNSSKLRYFNHPSINFYRLVKEAN